MPRACQSAHAESKTRRRPDQPGVIADGQLVVAGSDRPVLLEPGDRPLDHIALLGAHRIQLGWAATPGAAPGLHGLLVGALGDGVGDPALA
jgi:hypothetical protein